MSPGSRRQQEQHRDDEHGRRDGKAPAPPNAQGGGPRSGDVRRGNGHRPREDHLVDAPDHPRRERFFGPAQQDQVQQGSGRPRTGEGSGQAQGGDRPGNAKGAAHAPGRAPSRPPGLGSGGRGVSTRTVAAPSPRPPPNARPIPGNTLTETANGMLPDRPAGRREREAESSCGRASSSTAGPSAPASGGKSGTAEDTARSRARDTPVPRAPALRRPATGVPPHRRAIRPARRGRWRRRTGSACPIRTSVITRGASTAPAA